MPSENAPTAQCLPADRQALPAAERLLLLGREWLSAALLAECATGPQPEVEVVEDLGRLRFSRHVQGLYSLRRLCRHAFSTFPTCISAGNDRPESIEALGRLVEEARPDLVIASGDLTHRGLRSQHERASSFLHSLELPLLAIPGNHDIPYTFPRRFTRPWQEFERLWETTEPVYRSDTLVVAGLNSVRPWRHQSGRLRDEQVRHASEVFREIPTGVYRIVALHHHLLGAPWRSRKKPVAKRNRVLAGLVEAGADLVLAGHIHQSTVAERREFELATPGGEHAVVVSIAPGFGQPRPNRRGEARGLHIYEIGEDAAHPHVYLARGRLGAHGRAVVPARPRATCLYRKLGIRGSGCPARRSIKGRFAASLRQTVALLWPRPTTAR